MKRHQTVSSSRRKSRKTHFAAHSGLKRHLMSCRLSKDLRGKHNVRSIPIKVGDEVKVLKGKFKNKTGKVIQVYRKKWCIHVDILSRDNQNGQTVQTPLKPSYCVIEKLQLDQDRKTRLQTRASEKGKINKHKEKDVNMVE